MTSERVKKACVAVFVAGLFLPILQMQLHWVRETGLTGVSEAAVDNRQYRVKEFFSGAFQKHLDNLVNNQFGFRNYFIKLKNQLYFSLFNESANQNIVIGKDGQLLENVYVQDFLGVAPFAKLDEAALEASLVKVKAVQDWLEARHKTFLLFITPNKVTVLPEYVPDYLLKYRQRENRNHQVFLGLLDKYGIKYVDVASAVTALRGQSPNVLFPRGGTHWNQFTAAFAANQLVEGINRYAGLHLIPNEIAALNPSNSPEGSDKDLVELLNLLIKPLNYPVFKPSFKPVAPAADRPRVFWEGGSFNHSLLDVFNANRTFASTRFYFYYYLEWYYDDTKTPREEVVRREINKAAIDWQKDILDNDVFLLEVNDFYIHENIGSGFLDAFLAETGKKQAK